MSSGDKWRPPFSDDPRSWEVISSHYVARKDWFTVRVDHVRLPNGAEIPEYWVSEYRPWVNVVAVTESDDVVLIRQYRHGLAAVHFELPAGTTDSGEGDLEAAARRELTEETGYGGGRWSPLFSLSANPALQNNLTHTFLAEGVTALDRPRPDSSEDLRIHLVPVAEVAALIEDGGFIQALHVAPLLRYLMRRRDRERPTHANAR
jgi:8-oxo-dGTP pyrophosphatase MutT (NUDIX family)